MSGREAGQGGGGDEQQEEQELVSRIGPIQVDWPRSLGYFGGVAVAVAFGVIEWPLGVFIAAVPFLKLLKHQEAPLPQRALAAVLEGAAKPVGGDSDATVRPAEPPTPAKAGAARRARTRPRVPAVQS